MAKWNPSKRIAAALRRLQGQIARAILAADPRVAHRDGTKPRGRTGGSLAAAVRSSKILRVARWGAVLELAKVGAKLRFFAQGTSRQKARPIPTTPDVAKLTAELQADSKEHFDKRARGRP